MICLTFDTDNMTEEWMAEFLKKFDWPGKATFFCHRYFSCLDRSRHEVGLHPYLQSLPDVEQAVCQLRNEVSPSAIGIRSHSCVTSHVIVEAFHKLGMQYCSNHEFLYQTSLRPFRQPWGLWELPIYYMDNMDFWFSEAWEDLEHEPFRREVMEQAFDSDGLFVFAFHPLHIALNTRRLSDYNQVRENIYEGRQAPFAMTFPGRGTRTFFEELLDMACEQGESFLSGKDVLETIEQRQQVL
jgi:hypothetical protein